eukprot:6177323-Pleurochrysis_carterae.AAC.7
MQATGLVSSTQESHQQAHESQAKSRSWQCACTRNVLSWCVSATNDFCSILGGFCITTIGAATSQVGVSSSRRASKCVATGAAERTAN